MELLYEFYRVLGEVQPRYWCLENVSGARPYFGTPHVEFRPWYLWGNFPFFMFWADRLWKNTKVKSRRFRRDPSIVAEIPLRLSQPLAQAIRAALEKVEVSKGREDGAPPGT